MTNQEPERNPLRKIPTQIVPASTADIGSVLRKARLKKGHSLEVVGQHTRISKKFLEALEENRFEDFPAPAYLRGFLKCYCEYLELEFDPLWKSAFPEATAPAPKEAAPAPAAPAQLPSSLGLFVVVLALASAAILFWAGRTHEPEPEAAQRPADPPAALQPLPALEQPRLNLVFKNESWISLKIDGQLKFEGRVPQGTRQEWKAQKSFLLRAPNPADMTVALNGLPYALAEADAAGDYLIEPQ